jgi:hypothetical protein
MVHYDDMPEGQWTGHHRPDCLERIPQPENDRMPNFKFEVGQTVFEWGSDIPHVVISRCRELHQGFHYSSEGEEWASTKQYDNGYRIYTDGGFVTEAKLSRFPTSWLKPTHEDHLAARRECEIRNNFPLGQWVKNDEGNVGRIAGYNLNMVKIECVINGSKRLVLYDPARLTKIPAPPFEVGDWVEASAMTSTIKRVCRLNFHAQVAWRFQDQWGGWNFCYCYHVVAHDKEGK